MNFDYSTKTLELQQKLREFMDAHIYPNEKAYEGEINTGDRWQPSALIEDLKRQARADNLWNLFLPEVSGLTNLEYAPLAETMGKIVWASEIFNCSGSPGEIRHRRAEKKVARTFIERRNSLVFCDDRTGRRVERRDEYSFFD
jgi:acyl-CoA dehydrogenase